MKTTLIFLLTFIQITLSAQMMQQDFSSSSALADYISSNPGNSLFNSISTSGAGVTVSIQSNRLRFVRAGANTGSFTRNTDMVGPPTSLLCQFDLSVTGSTTAATSIALFYIGNNFSTTNTTEANADVFARFSLNTTTTDGNFQIRDITNGTNSITLSGTVRIWWVLNNSGATKEYRAPDGAIATIATGKADLWAGTSLLFNEVSVQTSSQSMADLKFINNQGSQTIDIDNILIDPIPAATFSNSATSVAANSFTANWTTVAGVTGYRLDVSKVSDFSTFVSGYNGLYVDGALSSSAQVTGLLWGNTYYYRVRSSSKYTIGEAESGNSNVTFVVTGILPVKFTNIIARKKGLITEVTYEVSSESGIRHYELERSFDAITFLAVDSTPAVNGSDIQEYLIEDIQPVATKTYYRIAAVTSGGNREYSYVISAGTWEKTKPYLKLLSNPVAGDLVFLPVNIPEQKYTVLILNMSGEILLRREMIFRKGMMTTIPLHRFQSGTYILMVKGVVQLSELFVTGR